jgi:hypothetical protein
MTGFVFIKTYTSYVFTTTNYVQIWNESEIAKTEVLGNKCVLVLNCQPQIPHERALRENVPC